MPDLSDSTPSYVGYSTAFRSWTAVTHSSVQLAKTAGLWVAVLVGLVVISEFEVVEQGWASDFVGYGGAIVLVFAFDAITVCWIRQLSFVEKTSTIMAPIDARVFRLFGYQLACLLAFSSLGYTLEQLTSFATSSSLERETQANDILSLILLPLVIGISYVIVRILLFPVVIARGECAFRFLEPFRVSWRLTQGRVLSVLGGMITVHAQSIGLTALLFISLLPLNWVGSSVTVSIVLLVAYFAILLTVLALWTGFLTLTYEALAAEEEVSSANAI